MGSPSRRESRWLAVLCKERPSPVPDRRPTRCLLGVLTWPLGIRAPGTHAHMLTRGSPLLLRELKSSSSDPEPCVFRQPRGNVADRLASSQLGALPALRSPAWCPVDAVGSGAVLATAGLWLLLTASTRLGTWPGDPSSLRTPKPGKQERNSACKPPAHVSCVQTLTQVYLFLSQPPACSWRPHCSAQHCLSSKLPPPWGQGQGLFVHCQLPAAGRAP